MSQNCFTNTHTHIYLHPLRRKYQRNTDQQQTGNTIFLDCVKSTTYLLRKEWEGTGMKFDDIVHIYIYMCVEGVNMAYDGVGVASSSSFYN